MSSGIYKLEACPDGRRSNQKPNSNVQHSVVPSVGHSVPSHMNWVSGPLQPDPPIEFLPQALELGPDFQKPAPESLPGRTRGVTVQGDEAFKTFQKVDEHAIAVSHRQQNSFNQLIWQLIYARNITSELDRVRALFLWLCTKDLHQMKFSKVSRGSPEEILMGIKSGKFTYAQIFQTLCRYANLHCKLLLGYAKGAEYSPGMRFAGMATCQHSWNAVLVDGIWCPIDCHWAARRLIVKRASVEDVRYALDTFYFLTDPSQLIYTHFPHEIDWQLLRKPITLEEFETLPFVKSGFFKKNLSLMSHRSAVILFSEPEVRVVIGFPDQSLMFTIGLVFDDTDSSEHYKNIPLLRYTRQDLVPSENSVAFYIRPPRPGSYKLSVYAKERDWKRELDGVTKGPPDTAEEHLYGVVCEYRLVARYHDDASLPPYPPCQTYTYGATEMLKRFDLVPLIQEPVLRAQDGMVEVRFALSVRSQRLPRIMGTLACSFLPDQSLENCILQRVVKNDTEAVVTVFLPETGEFGLEVYANDPDRDGLSFFAIWQYLITCDTPSKCRGLPSIPPTYLGPTPQFHSLSLQLVSHTDPLIVADTAELTIHLSYLRERPIKMTAQLIYASDNANEDYSQMVLQQMRSNQVYFIVRTPKLGFFKLQIYALPENDRNDSLPGVYNYLIEATSTSYRVNDREMPFPRQFAHWRRKACFLDTPTEGILGLDTDGRLMAKPPVEIPFSLAVPNAHTVAVVIDQDWTYLQQFGERWKGSVNMKPHWGKHSKICVCAKYLQSDINFSTLLEYAIAA